ncbi:MAG: hypothetical protein JWO71_771 [Candidatus Acidoferrum typicum]|nr:hypothetical protein [Candidatus Acidoferrum typicum]
MPSRSVTLPAANELHDFVAIARCDERLRPLRARQNLEVALDGDAAAVEIEFAQQVRNARARLRAAIFTVH